VVVARAREQVARQVEPVQRAQKLVVDVAEGDLDVAREELVALREVDPPVDDAAERVAGGREGAPDVQQVVLIDGPAVLGWAQWRAIDEATSGRLLAEALTTLIEEGTVARQPVEPLTRLLSGAMNEAALWLARSPDPPRDLADTWAALSRLLGSLRA